jgi:hypothetical protein
MEQSRKRVEEIETLEWEKGSKREIAGMEHREW